MKIIVYEIQNTWKISVSENCNLLSSGQFVVYCLVSLLLVLLYDSTAVVFSFFFLSCFFLCCLLVFKRFQFYLPFLLPISFCFFTKFLSWLLFQLSNLCIITTKLFILVAFSAFKLMHHHNNFFEIN